MPLPTTCRSAGQSRSVALAGEAGGGEVVDERVEPDVHRLVAVAGEGNAPARAGAATPRCPAVRPAAGARSRCAGSRAPPGSSPTGDPLQQRVPVAAQPEEVVALLGPHQLERRMLDAVAVLDLRRLLELLAAGAIQALVVTHVEIVGIPLLDPSEQLGHRLAVARLGGPDPVVVADLEPAPEIREPLGHPVHPCLRRVPVLLRGLDHRLGVLVHPHEEMHVVAAEAPIAGDAVGSDLLQRVPQVGVAVGVVDRRGDVELGHAER